MTSRLALSQPGGIESAVREVAERIADARPAWSVRCVHAFERPSRLNRIPFLGDLIAALILSKRSRSADVILVNGGEYAWPHVLTKRGRAKTIVVWHGTRAGEIPALVPKMGIAIRIYLWLEILLQWPALRAGRQIAVSDSTIAELHRTYGATARIVLNGATPLSRRDGAAATVDRLAWLGTTPYKKGLDLAIETCRVLRAEGCHVHLTVIGLESIPAYANEAWITWAGRLDHNGALDRIRQCAIFLGTTRYEGCSVAVIEALALGVPIVASPQIAWMVPDGEGGVAVAEATPRAFAAATRTLLEDSQLRAELSSRAVKRSAAFDWNAAANAYVGEIETVLSTKAR